MLQWINSILNKPRTALYYAIGIHAVYFIAACIHQHIYLVDSLGYLAQGQNILKHGSWYAAGWNGPTQIDQFSFRPPLYGLFTALCVAVFKSHLGILFVQNVLAVLTYAAAFNLLRKQGVKPVVINTVALLMLTFVPTPLLMANMVMADVVLMAQLMGVVYLLLQLHQQFYYTHIVLLGVLLTSILFNKPVGLLLPVIAVVWLWLFTYEHWPLKQLIISSIILLLLPALGFHAINKQQQHQTGYYHYTSIKPFTQQKFHARYTLAYLYGQDSADAWQAQCNVALQQTQTYKERYELMQQLGDDVLKQHLVPFLYLYAKGVLVFFLDPGRHDLFAFWGYTRFEQIGLFHRTQSEGISAITEVLRSMPWHMLLLLSIAFVSNLIVFALLIYYAFSHFRPNAIAWLLLFIIGYVALATGMLGVARYKTAVFPLLMMVAALAIQLFIHYWKSKRA